MRSEPGYTENLRLPVVPVVHEGGGLHVNDHAKEKALALAEEGYLALALDIYGEGKITDLLQRHDESEPVKEQLLKERFLAAYELLQDHKLSEKGEIAAIGYCFDGSAVLRMAQTGGDLRGVLRFHGVLPTASVKHGAIKATILDWHGADDKFVGKTPSGISTSAHGRR